MSSIFVAFFVASVVLWTVLLLTSGRRQRPGAVLHGSVLRSVLLADDSVTIRKVVESALEGSGLEVVTVPDGRQALQALDARDFDLVLADLHMPELDGLEVCRHAKSQDPARPVVLLVGIFEPRNEAVPGAHGVDHVLEKPFDGADLIALVARLGERRERPL